MYIIYFLRLNKKIATFYLIISSVAVMAVTAEAMVILIFSKYEQIQGRRQFKKKCKQSSDP